MLAIPEVCSVVVYRGLLSTALTRAGSCDVIPGSSIKQLLKTLTIMEIGLGFTGHKVMTGSANLPFLGFVTLI